ncbi:hypothetical protein B0T20DRAFT_411752 [Sordaria brevicollis]|uniref:Uncharacterized protein n=1 Tax=Sordaria brevicollis TaxID=83679 RepID=A0AAE0PEX0_SORBR|nr:hypothetical protein B0T20DRAFT_411752 [Sordaria brevicollis]
MEGCPPRWIVRQRSRELHWTHEFNDTHEPTGEPLNGLNGGWVCRERWWAVDFRFLPLQRQPGRDQITDCTLEVRYRIRTPLSSTTTTIVMNVSLREMAEKKSGKMKKDGSRKSQAFCDSISLTLKKRLSFTASSPRPQNHGTRPDRGPKGEGEMAPHDRSVFFISLALSSLQTQRRRQKIEKASCAERRTLTAGQPVVIVVAWFTRTARLPS